MTKINTSRLREVVIKLLRNTTEENPVHWLSLTEKLVDSGQWTNEQLVSVMNSLLVPFGNVRGSNHNFWLPES
jgi:hypothetical protein